MRSLQRLQADTFRKAEEEAVEAVVRVECAVETAGEIEGMEAAAIGSVRADFTSLNCVGDVSKAG